MLCDGCFFFVFYIFFSLQFHIQLTFLNWNNENELRERLFRKCSEQGRKQ